MEEKPHEIRGISAAEIIGKLTQPQDEAEEPVYTLRHRSVVGKLDLKYRTIEIAVDIQECEFLDEVDLRYCEFKQVVDLSKCFFKKHFDSGNKGESHTIYRKDLICRGAKFEGPFDLNGGLIEGSAFFAGAKFLSEERSVDFRWTSVGETLEFQKTLFKAEAEFSNVKCAGIGLFDNATFEGKVNFSRASFGTDLNCQRAIFEAEAIFNALNCGDSAVFSPATFEEKADFTHASFGKNLDCEDASFQGPATFRSLRCDEGAFGYSRFLGPTDFSFASFGVGVHCWHTIFEGPLSFNSVECDGSGIFRGATLLGNADFSFASFGKYLDCSEATFQDQASFYALECNGVASFRDAKFEGDEEINFRSASVGGDLDIDTASFKRRPVALDTEEEQQILPSFMEFGQVLATYIGIPVVLLYPVGFLVYVLQINSFYPFDFSTAWYAASLIPATVVTGQGAKYLLIPLLISLIVSSLAARALVEVGGEELSREFSQLQQFLRTLGQRSIRTLSQQILRTLRRRSISIPSLLFLVLIGASLLAIALALNTGREGLLYWAFLIPSGVLFGLIGAVLIVRSYYRESHIAENEQSQGAQGNLRWLLGILDGYFGWLSRGVRERWIFAGLLTAYAGSVVAAFLIVLPLDALDQDPDLPHVKMKVPGHPIEDGVLLSHSDGYWHVIDTSRIDSDADIERQSFIISPGKDVSDVRVFESPLQEADLDLAFASRGSPWVSQYLTYTVKVTNKGPDTATGIELTNNLPDKDVKFDSAKRGQKEIRCPSEENPSDGSVRTCLVGHLDRDNAAEIHIKVKPTAEGSYSFAADVNGAQRDADPIDERRRDFQVKIDPSAPETEKNLRPEPNSGGWHNSDVTVSLTADDVGDSGVKEIVYRVNGGKVNTVQGDSVQLPDVNNEGTTTIEYHAVDNAGNIEPPEELKVKLDKTPPGVTIGSGPEGPTKDSTPSFGFSSDEDGSTFECRLDDATFGPCNPTQTYDDLRDGDHTFQVRAKDKADNVGNVEERNFVVDTAKPVVDCEAANDSWQGQDVSIECSASDKGSGLSDNSVSLVTSVPDDSQTDNASTNSHEICDAADNCATAGPIRGIKIDKKAPGITIKAPDDGGEYELEETVTAKYACFDGGGSGVSSCEGPVAKNSDIDTDLGGSRSFEVEATDAAGNMATRSHTYVVAYGFDRFLPPLKAPPALNVTRAGEPVLVRFGLRGGQGKNIYAQGYPRSVEIECDSQAPLNPLLDSNPHHTADHHDYVWKPQATWSGACRRLMLKLNDGSTHALNFKFDDE